MSTVAEIKVAIDKLNWAERSELAGMVWPDEETPPPGSARNSLKQGPGDLFREIGSLWTRSSPVWDESPLAGR